MELNDAYKHLKIDVYYFCHVNNIGLLEGNIIKYVTRKKNRKEDLIKAKNTIDRLIAFEDDLPQ